jgi:hypothetical protein
MAGRREREDQLTKRLLPLFVLARIAEQVSRSLETSRTGSSQRK